MVTDAKTGECYRADHLLEHHLEALLEDTKNPLPADKKKVGLRADDGASTPACMHACVRIGVGVRALACLCGHVVGMRVLLASNDPKPMDSPAVDSGWRVSTCARPLLLRRRLPTFSQVWGSSRLIR